MAQQEIDITLSVNLEKVRITMVRAELGNRCFDVKRICTKSVYIYSTSYFGSI